MARKRYGQACPVAKSLEVVGERWTLLLVRDLLGGPRKFQDFQASLPGIAPALLSERLKLMEEHELRYLPVVDREMRIVGIFSRAEIQEKQEAVEREKSEPSAPGIRPSFEA